VRDLTSTIYPTRTRNNSEEMVGMERPVHRRYNRHGWLDRHRTSNEERQTQPTTMDYQYASGICGVITMMVKWKLRRTPACQDADKTKMQHMSGYTRMKMQQRYGEIHPDTPRMDDQTEQTTRTCRHYCRTPTPMAQATRNHGHNLHHTTPD
jgi:hypothetical protein